MAALGLHASNALLALRSETPHHDQAKTLSESRRIGTFSGMDSATVPSSDEPGAPDVPAAPAITIRRWIAHFRHNLTSFLRRTRRSPAGWPEDNPERVGSPRSALVGLSLAMLLSSLGTSSANVGLPALEQAFNASFAQLQWVVLAYLLAVTTLIVGMGRLGDVVGRRRLLLIGLVLFTLASALCGVALVLWQLIAARALQGAGAAIMMALVLALVSDTVSKDRTGAAIGWLGTMSAVGTALGPALGGLLVGSFGWRAIFLINVPLGLLALVFVQRNLPVDVVRPRLSDRGLDPVGTLLLASALAAYALAMTMMQGDFGWFNLALLLMAALIAGLFVLVERRVATPLIRLELLRDHGLAARLLTTALVATVMMATLVVGPFYLAQGLGLSAAAVGLALTAGPLVAALSGVPAGRCVDRLGATRVTIAGLVAMATGSLVLCLLPTLFSGLAGYVVPIVIITSGYAVFQAANTSAMMGGVSADQRGVVSGLLNLSRNLGLVTGASAMAALFAKAMDTRVLTGATSEAVTYGMRIVFAAAAAMILASIVIAMTSAAMTRTQSTHRENA